MAEENEKGGKGAMIAGGVVGAGAGAALMTNRQANNLVFNALEGTGKHFAEGKGAAFKGVVDGVANAAVENGKTLAERFAVSKDGVLKGLGDATGAMLEGDKAAFKEGAEVLKTHKKELKQVISETRKALPKGNKLLSSMSGGQYGKIAAATVASAVVLGLGAHMLFGNKGKHTSRVEDERAQATATGRTA